MIFERSSNNSYQAQCAELELTLINVFQCAANILLDSDQINFYNNVAIQLFRKCINPNSDYFIRKVTTRINTLANELETTAQFDPIFASDYPSANDNSNLGVLFRSPKKIIDGYYEQLEQLLNSGHVTRVLGIYKFVKQLLSKYKKFKRFGIIIDNQFYNFDEPLKLLFKIIVLRRACSKDNFSNEWVKNKFEALQIKVSEFAIAAENRAQLIQLLHPRNISTRIAEVVLGKELIDFFIDTFDFLETRRKKLFGILIKHYRFGYKIKYSEKLTAGIFVLIQNALIKFPLKTVKSILGLPFRLAQVAVNLVTEKQSSLRANAHYFLTVTNMVINDIINVTLGLGLWILVPVANAIFSILASFIVYPLIMAFPRLIIKPIIDLFIEPTSPPEPQPSEPEPQQQQWPSLQQPWLASLAKLQQHIRSNPSHGKISINCTDITPTQITNEMNVSRRGEKSEQLHWLKTIVDHQKHFILRFQNQDDTSILYHITIGKDRNFPTSLDELIKKNRAESLTLDWVYYKHQEKPSLEDISHVVNQLNKRTQPLKKLYLLTNVMTDAFVNELCKVNFADLQLETFGIPIQQLLTDDDESVVVTRLMALQTLVQNPSIKYIPSLTNNRSQNPESPFYLPSQAYSIYQSILSTLEKNRNDAVPKDNPTVLETVKAFALNELPSFFSPQNNNVDRQQLAALRLQRFQPPNKKP